jgi:4-aminobutyrate aminotransferase
MKPASSGSSAAAHRLSPVWLRYTDLEIGRGEGVRVHARDGRTYLDFTAGIAVTSTGHCHPSVVAAIQRQAERLLHGQLTVAYNQPALELAEELSTLLPERLGCFFFANSGSEAVESALKLARHATGRPNAIAFQGGYHGRTLGALSLSSAKSVYRSGYQPLVAGVTIAPYPYALRHGGGDPASLAEHCLGQLELILETTSTPEETAAMIVEPILGEGGYVVPPAGFVRGLREICDRTGILLIADEAQSGFGRTGRMFACEHFEIWPDVIVLAKGIASGMPLSGIASSHELMAAWRPGSHGGTFGGNPVCAAAGVETLRVLRDEGLVENAARQGELLLRLLGDLQRRSGALAEVRGVGLMVGCELATRHGLPDPDTARRVRERCLAEGLLLSTCGAWDQVIRWIPPLTVGSREIETAVRIFAAALEAVEADDGRPGPEDARQLEEVG